MRIITVFTLVVLASPCFANSLYQCACFENCAEDWTLDGMIIDGCDLINPTGEWHRAQVGAGYWENYLVTIEVYTGDGTTVYFDAMGEVVAFFVASETTNYAVLLDYGSETSGTLFGPGPFRLSWWNIQFGFFDGNLVYRHWPEGSEAPGFLTTFAPSSGLFGPLTIRAYSGVEAAIFRNLQVDGLGPVANEVTSWGLIKTNFR